MKITIEIDEKRERLIQGESLATLQPYQEHVPRKLQTAVQRLLDCFLPMTAPDPMPAGWERGAPSIEWNKRNEAWAAVDELRKLLDD